MKFLFPILSLFFASLSFGEDLDKLLKKHGFEKGSLSYHVIDLESGKVARSLNEKRPMILASVSKILSLYYSLSVLGADFKFQTTLGFKGKIQKETLKGDLHLKGGGDPYLSAAHLMSMALALKDKGIEKLEGDLYYDQEALPFVHRLSPIGLEDQPDNPSIGALNAEFNRFKVHKTGHPLPLLPHLKITESKEKFPKGLKFKNTVRDSEEIWVHGKKSKRKYVEDLPSRNAGLFAANYFRYLCSLLNIELSPPKAASTPSDSKVLYTHESLPMIRLASLAMEYSNNLFAELPALTASKRLTGSKLSLANSAAQMKAWLESDMSHINFKNARFHNASGLGVDNLLSARALSEVLYAVHQKEFGQRKFWSLLSINGHSGWMARRLSSPQLAFRVWAKTGSLFYVSNIAGYYISSEGKRMAFSMLLTDEAKRSVLNNPLSKEAGQLREHAKQWHKNATNFLDGLLRSWIKL